MKPYPIRYARLGYVALDVTDVTASVNFYVDLVGLALASSDDRSARLRCSDKPYDLILEKGDVPGLRRVGMELEDRQALRGAFEHLSSVGLNPQWTASADFAGSGYSEGFRFRNPDTSLELDFYCEQVRASQAYSPTVTNIARLGHVVLNVSSYPDAHRFWVEQLGFAVSDHVPGKIAFLRAFPNPLHHSLALISGPSDGFNHLNFMVTDIDDIGCAMNRMKKADVPIVFGPGRHLPSTSIFLYFLDPDGMTAELSFGMDEIGEHDHHVPRELEPTPEVLDTWGSLPDPRFGQAGKILGSDRPVVRQVEPIH